MGTKERQERIRFLIFKSVFSGTLMGDYNRTALSEDEEVSGINFYSEWWNLPRIMDVLRKRIPEGYSTEEVSNALSHIRRDKEMRKLLDL